METKFITSIRDFFLRSFQHRKNKMERDVSLLRESFDLLQELRQSWETSQVKHIDLVDYTNLLLQKAQGIKIRKNKLLARELLLFAKRNCLAGSIPHTEIKRVQRETEELLEKMKTSLDVNEIYL